MTSEKLNFPSEYFSPEQNKAAESEQEMIWNDKRKEVDRIVDGLGLGIDEGIKETVTALRVYGLNTQQSCEGHMRGEGRRIASLPWITICVPEPKGWEKAKDKIIKQKKGEIVEDPEQQKKTEEFVGKAEVEWRVKNFEQYKKAMDLLEDFYRQRETPFEARLTFSLFGSFGAFRIQNLGFPTVPLLSQEEQFKKLELYRKEMNDFAEFLKNKHLGKK